MKAIPSNVPDNSSILRAAQLQALLFILCRRRGKRNQNLIGMQSWIVASKILDFESLDRLDGFLGY